MGRSLKYARDVAFGVVALFVVLMVIVVATSDKDGEDEESPAPGAEAPIAEKAKAISADEIRASVGKTATSFVAANGYELVRLEVSAEDERTLRIVAHLSPTPAMTVKANRAIVHALVQLSLDALIATGRDPHEEWIFVSAYAYQAMERTSPTGRTLVRTHARAQYNFGGDAIEIEPFSP